MSRVGRWWWWLVPAVLGACTFVGSRDWPPQDSDGDGISDLQELSDGTDPTDAWSAMAWHPELTARPRLLVTEPSLPALLSALERDGEPWETLRGRLRSHCDRESVPDGESLDGTYQNTNFALACAVLYAGGDAAAGQRAVDLLEALPTEVEIGLAHVYKTDLHGGQAILQGARAWDLLLGVGYPEGRDPGVARAQLHGLAETLWRYYIDDYPTWMALAQNNHATKLAAAFGVLGLGANDDPRSARYVSFALTEVPRLHDLLLADDGGYAEGPSYLVYAQQSVLPWMVALDSWLGDDTLSTRTTCVHSRTPETCVEEPVEVSSVLRDPRVCGGFDRFVESFMPSGHAPNTDDGNLTTGSLGFTAGICGSPTQSWGWEWQASAWMTSGSVDSTADALVHWAGAPAGMAPPTGPLSRPDAGWVVLRDRWDRDAPWAMLLAERGPALLGGGQHEHPDGLALLWAARGEYLLLDSGYGYWEIHDAVNGPEAHSAILVDGAGPAGVASEILDAYADGPVQVARARVSHHGVEWTRTLGLVGEDVLVVRDETASDDGQVHTLTHTLHGATDTLVQTPPHSRWTVAGLTLDVVVLADTDPSYHTRVAEHALGRSLDEHGVAEAELTTDQPVTWLTVAWVHDGTGVLQVDGTTLRWAGGSASLDGTVTVGTAVVALPGG